jgi:hypothetical protein
MCWSCVVAVILLLRVWVLYSKSKKIGIFLGIFLLIGCGIALYIRIWKPDVCFYSHPIYLCWLSSKGAFVHPFRQRGCRPLIPLLWNQRFLLYSTSFFDHLSEDPSEWWVWLLYAINLLTSILSICRSLLLTDRPGLYAHSWQFFYFIIILFIDVGDLLESIRPVPCLSNILGPLILYGHVESLYYLDGVTFNSNTHRLIDAVRSTFNI